MNRVMFVESMQCQEDLQSHFDEIMSMYDLSSSYSLDNISYTNNLDTLSFDVLLPSINKATEMKEVLSRVGVSKYGKQFDLDLLQHDNIINITLK